MCPIFCAKDIMSDKFGICPKLLVHSQVQVEMSYGSTGPQYEDPGGPGPGGPGRGRVPRVPGRTESPTWRIKMATRKRTMVSARCGHCSKIHVDPFAVF